MAREDACPQCGEPAAGGEPVATAERRCDSCGAPWPATHVPYAALAPADEAESDDDLVIDRWDDAAPPPAAPVPAVAPERVVFTPRPEAAGKPKRWFSRRVKPLHAALAIVAVAFLSLMAVAGVKLLLDVRSRWKDRAESLASEGAERPDPIRPKVMANHESYYKDLIAACRARAEALRKVRAGAAGPRAFEPLQELVSRVQSRHFQPDTPLPNARERWMLARRYRAAMRRALKDVRAELARLSTDPVGHGPFDRLLREHDSIRKGLLPPLDDTGAGTDVVNILLVDAESDDTVAAVGLELQRLADTLADPDDELPGTCDLMHAGLEDHSVPGYRVGPVNDPALLARQLHFGRIARLDGVNVYVEQAHVLETDLDAVRAERLDKTMRDEPEPPGSDEKAKGADDK